MGNLLPRPVGGHRLFLPVSLIVGVLLMAAGVPMTLAPAPRSRRSNPGAMGNGEDGKAKPQEIARGPVAAVMPIKHLGTNGGGFFGANSAHPFENPNALTNFLDLHEHLALSVLPGGHVRRMLKRLRHAGVIYAVMMVLLVGMIIWAVCWDTMQPNPA